MRPGRKRTRAAARPDRLWTSVFYRRFARRFLRSYYISSRFTGVSSSELFPGGNLLAPVRQLWFRATCRMRFEGAPRKRTGVRPPAMVPRNIPNAFPPPSFLPVDFSWRSTTRRTLSPLPRARDRHPRAPVAAELLYKRGIGPRNPKKRQLVMRPAEFDWRPSRSKARAPASGLCPHPSPRPSGRWRRPPRSCYTSAIYIHIYIHIFIYSYIYIYLNIPIYPYLSLFIPKYPYLSLNIPKHPYFSLNIPIYP